MVRLWLLGHVSISGWGRIMGFLIGFAKETTLTSIFTVRHKLSGDCWENNYPIWNKKNKLRKVHYSGLNARWDMTLYFRKINPNCIALSNEMFTSSIICILCTLWKTICIETDTQNQSLSFYYHMHISITYLFYFCFSVSKEIKEFQPMKICSTARHIKTPIVSNIRFRQINKRLIDCFYFILGTWVV